MLFHDSLETTPKVRALPFMPRLLQERNPDAYVFHCSDSSMYSQSLYKLVSESYLKPSTVLSHNSPRDKRIKYEGEEKAKITGFPTAKELREVKVTAQVRLKREEEEAEKVGLVCSFQRDVVAL